jgi:uncharacterized Zn finger protein
MTVLTDSWARRLKTCLEHLIRQPITIDERMLAFSNDRLNYYSILTFMTQSVNTLVQPNSAQVTSGCITIHASGATVELHLPSFTDDEKEMLVSVFAGRIKYSILLAAWAEVDARNRVQDVSLSEKERETFKEQLDLDLIEHGLHAIPYQKESFQISCDCKNRPSSRGMVNDNALYCQHVYQSLPAMLVYLNANPSRVLLLRGVQVSELAGLVCNRVARMDSVLIRTPDSEGSTTANGALEPPNTARPVNSNDPGDMVSSYWSYQEHEPSPPASDTSDIVIPRVTNHPFDATNATAAHTTGSRAPPARIRSILTAIYDYLDTHQEEPRKLMASIAASRKDGSMDRP